MRQEQKKYYHDIALPQSDKNETLMFYVLCCVGACMGVCVRLSVCVIIISYDQYGWCVCTSINVRRFKATKWNESESSKESKRKRERESENNIYFLIYQRTKSIYFWQTLTYTHFYISFYLYKNVKKSHIIWVFVLLFVLLMLLDFCLFLLTYTT